MIFDKHYSEIVPDLVDSFLHIADPLPIFIWEKFCLSKVISLTFYR